MFHRSAFVLYWLPALGWMAAIVIVPRFLGPSLPSPGSVLDELIRSGIHVVEYGILALLVHRAVQPRLHRHRNPGQLSVGWKPYLLAFLVATLYAIFDEAHQGFIPNRQPSFLDFLADILGSLLALAGIAVIQADRAAAERGDPDEVQRLCRCWWRSIRSQMAEQKAVHRQTE